MTKIEAIIRPETFESVKQAVGRLRVGGMTVSEVAGCGLQRGTAEREEAAVGTYRGSEYALSLRPKLKLEIVVRDRWAEEVINAIKVSARTGKIGDGKIFIHKVADVVRIRTGERGEDAV